MLTASAFVRLLILILKNMAGSDFKTRVSAGFEHPTPLLKVPICCLQRLNVFKSAYVAYNG